MGHFLNENLLQKTLPNILMDSKNALISFSLGENLIFLFLFVLHFLIFSFTLESFFIYHPVVIDTQKLFI